MQTCSVIGKTKPQNFFDYRRNKSRQVLGIELLEQNLYLQKL